MWPLHLCNWRFLYSREDVKAEYTILSEEISLALDKEVISWNGQ